MSDRPALYGDLARAYDGEPWHGPSITALLADVDALTAAARPIPDAHSVWELVLHLAAWTGEVARRLRGEPPAEPAEGDWPPVAAPRDDAAWREARARLAAAQADFLAALAACPEERLRSIVGQTGNPTVGSGLTYAAMVSGLAQHYAYHGGQVAVLKRAAQRGRER